MVLVEEGYGKNVGEWAGKAERQWKHRTRGGREAKKEMDRKVSVSASVLTKDGIVALRKAHTCFALSLSSLHKVALETVPIFVWLNTDCS